MTKPIVAIFISAFVLIIASCGSNNDEKPDISFVKIDQHFLRFEKDLFSAGDSMGTKEIQELHTKYEMFFELFCSRIIRIQTNNDSITAFHLRSFVSDPDIKEIYSLTDSLYSDTKDLQHDLYTAFCYYKHYFPRKSVPMIVTYISAFNYQVITADSVLGIGLDMYLGEDKQNMYGSIGFPHYMFRRFTKSYILVDAMKGWFQSEYDIDSVKNELLSQMIYHGKLLYFLDFMIPETNDTLKIGYTGEQLSWCHKNETNLWAHIIEQNLLYSTVQQEYFKYIQDGPATNGLPKESPARLGWFIGHKIVKNYMKESDASLEQLLNENDAQKILNASRYKPSK